MKISEGFKKYFFNTYWLSFEHVFRMIIAVFIGAYVARYLGAINYGLIQYSVSFVSIGAVFADLGLDQIVIRELVNNNHEQKQSYNSLLGTVFILKLISSFIVFVSITVIIIFWCNDSYLRALILIVASSMVFKSLYTIKFFFQAKVLSKSVVIVQTIAFLIISCLKIILVIYKASVLYFAILIMLDSIIIAIGLLLIYGWQNKSVFNWHFDYRKAKELLKYSWLLMFSGLAGIIYLRIDQIMIKQVLGLEAVGKYAVAVRISEIWYFIPMIITNSFFPAIIKARQITDKLYYERLQNLYCFMFYLAMCITIFIYFFANKIVIMLFGFQYYAAIPVLKIHALSIVFVFLGCISTKWLIADNLQNYILVRSIIGAILNILLNIYLIPKFGIKGAAVATVISYSFVSSFYLLFFAKIRKRGILLHIRSVNFFRLFKYIKDAI